MRWRSSSVLSTPDVLTPRISLTSSAVSGSGEAKISASRIAFKALSLLSTVCLRIANRMRRVGRPRAFIDADRPEPARLEHPHQLQPNHLEKREKRDDESAAIVSIGE